MQPWRAARLNMSNNINGQILCGDIIPGTFVQRQYKIVTMELYPGGRQDTVKVWANTLASFLGIKTLADFAEWSQDQTDHPLYNEYLLELSRLYITTGVVTEIQGVVFEQPSVEPTPPVHETDL